MAAKFDQMLTHMGTGCYNYNYTDLVILDLVSWSDSKPLIA